MNESMDFFDLAGPNRQKFFAKYDNLFGFDNWEANLVNGVCKFNTYNITLHQVLKNIKHLPTNCSVSIYPSRIVNAKTNIQCTKLSQDDVTMLKKLQFLNDNVLLNG